MIYEGSLLLIVALLLEKQYLQYYYIYVLYPHNLFDVYFESLPS